MAILHVRNVPDDLMQQLKERARAERRSLSAEVIMLLREGAYQPAADQGEVLAEIRRLRFRPAPGVPDSVELIREDRER